MNDEIDLILTKLKIVSEEQEQGMYLCDKKHSKLLLDCITNLQNENETLKELNVCVGCENNIDYKSRCDKAIPMLKELNIKLKDILKIGIDIKEISDIENILNGVGEE